MSSKTSNRLSGKEELSARYDGEFSSDGMTCINEDEKSSLQKWSLIGATLRNELSPQVNLDIASKVADLIAKEPVVSSIDQSDVSSVEVKKELKFETKTFAKFMRKFGFVLSQTAVAASIAMVTVIGYQTWNAEDNLSQDPVAVSAFGPVSNVNLASYQTSQSNNSIRLGYNVYNTENSELHDREAQIRSSQNQELERINNYIKGYVLSTASR